MRVYSEQCMDVCPDEQIDPGHLGSLPRLEKTEGLMELSLFVCGTGAGEDDMF